MKATQFVLLVCAGALSAWSVPSFAANNPTSQNFRWDGSMTSEMVMWPTSKGYCFLTGGSVGYAAGDDIGIYKYDGNWILDGISQFGSVVFATAECLAWPEGWNAVQEPYVTIGSLNIGESYTLCSIANLSYSGQNVQNQPIQPQILGYPLTNVISTLSESVQNNESQAVTMQSNCVTPTNSPNWYRNGPMLFTGVASTSQPMNLPFWSPHVCVINSVRTPALSGPITFQETPPSPTNFNWQIEMLNDEPGLPGDQTGAFFVTCIPFE